MVRGASDGTSPGSGGSRCGTSNAWIARRSRCPFLTTAPVLVGDGVPGLRVEGKDSMSDALRPAARRWLAGEDVVTELVLRP